MTGTKLSSNPASSSDVPVQSAMESTMFGFLSTTAGQVVLFVAFWIGIGLSIAVILRLRGHEFRSHAALGAVLGPAYVFLAYEAMQRRENEQPITITSSLLSSGSAVLVVAVGKLTEPANLLRAIEEVGEVGPVYAGVPVEYEVADRVHGLGADPPKSDVLDELASLLAEYSPGLLMLPGRMDKSIPEAVSETGARLVLLVGSDSASVADNVEEILGPSGIGVDSLSTD
jgi:hypothetical protein